MSRLKSVFRSHYSLFKKNRNILSDLTVKTFVLCDASRTSVKSVLLTWKNTTSKQIKQHPFQSKVFLLAGLTIGFSFYYYVNEKKKKKFLKASQPFNNAGVFNSQLPSYSLEDIAKHDSLSKRVWVTYNQGVYDITEFISNHPGGAEKIMMAAGGSVEPFWMIYGVHKNPQILGILEQYRIGNISAEDAKVATSNMEDPYGNEPYRHPLLRASSQRPFNAEPPPAILSDSFITPTDVFYVRNHLPVPVVEEASYELEISGVGVKSAVLTLADIKRFPKYSVTASIQCAGNRRSEMTKVKPVKGLDWGSCAIGNATWSGARLYDVLISLGLDENNPQPKHIQFEGLDTDVTNVSYGASIPIEKGMDPRGDVLLAYEMNGEPLSRDHGYPIRAVVPGVVGARNVKWLGAVIVSEEESSSHWQQNDYKGFSPSVDWHNVDFSSAPAIQELPVISAIGEPSNGDQVKLVDGKMQLKGYAYSGGGHRIVRVDLTADNGRSWHVAKLTHHPANPPRHWAWTLWHAELPIDPTLTQVEVWVKASDNSYNTQPESFENIWNLRGVLSNAYHRIKMHLELEGMKTIPEVYKCIRSNELSTTFPNLKVALRIFLALPVTNCSAERGFSVLSRVKNAKRSTLGEEKQNALVLMCSEHDVTLKTHFSEIVKNFAQTKFKTKLSFMFC